MAMRCPHYTFTIYIYIYICITILNCINVHITVMYTLVLAALVMYKIATKKILKNNTLCTACVRLNSSGITNSLCLLRALVFSSETK